MFEALNNFKKIAHTQVALPADLTLSFMGVLMNDNLRGLKKPDH